MARSEEALKRRAEKRQRSVEEQKVAEERDMKRPKEDSPLNETGAWQCPKCQNRNFASRRVCNSKTCNQVRPSHIPVPSPSSKRRFWEGSGSASSSSKRPRDVPSSSWRCTCGRKNFANQCSNSYCQLARPERKKKAKPRHDEETSKTLVWANQADDAVLTKNQELRKRYQETNGEGMELEDVERAKVLIARDERKRQKRKSPKSKTVTTANITEPAPAAAVVEGALAEISKTKKKSKREESKSKRDKNKALRKQFLDTKGEGMKPDQIERAKQLIERDERKRRKREEAEKNKQSPQ
eukprot:scaffold5901_cov116-Cylindrotheca_fusiformis.AAC.11